MGECMIEADFYNYLKNNVELTSLIPASNIYLGQIPDNVKMPYLLLEIFNGVRTPMGARRREITNPFKVSVYVDSANKVKGKIIIEKALSILENLRGAVASTDDVVVTCNSIGTVFTIGETLAYSFTGRIRYIDIVV